MTHQFSYVEIPHLVSQSLHRFLVNQMDQYWPSDLLPTFTKHLLQEWLTYGSALMRFKFIVSKTCDKYSFLQYDF